MCGIIGSVGNHDGNFVLRTLKKLDYRGYDSCGVSFLSNKGIETYKTIGRVDKLKKVMPSFNTSFSIAHTRWATHGGVNLNNTHPHLSFKKEFALVHNGTIDNYLELKEELLKGGVKFKGQTDSEVIVNLLEKEYQKTPDVLLCLKSLIQKLVGAYALAILHQGSKRLYFIKNRAPLSIAKTSSSYFVTSDIDALEELNAYFYDLNDQEYGFISLNDVVVFHNNKKVQPQFYQPEEKNSDISLGKYKHYMEKEIEEAPEVIKRLINHYYNDEYLFGDEMIKSIIKAKRLVFIASGTSYYAQLAVSKYYKKLDKEILSFLSSEFSASLFEFKKGDLFILISQSGETADLLSALDLLKKNTQMTIGISNQPNSTLLKNCTYPLRMYCQKEYAVASTKAYIGEVALLLLLYGAVTSNKIVVKDLKKVEKECYKIINSKNEIKNLCKYIRKAKSLLFIARGDDYHLALEASLKLKEVSYIHSEVIYGGELKHGPIALIKKNFPVIALSTSLKNDELLSNSIHEIKSRKAKVITLMSQKEKGLEGIKIPLIKYNELLLVMICQYLAYFTACKKRLDVDKPRNLAKSVTVE